MKELNPHSLINDLEKKLNALQAKMMLHRTLADSLSEEFDSLYNDFESLKANIGSTLKNNDTTLGNNESSFSKNDSTSLNTDSSSENNDTISDTIESSSNNYGASLSIPVLSGLIRQSAKKDLNIHFSYTNIPDRIAMILLEIVKRKSLTVMQMQEFTSASRNSIERDLRILKHLGWLKFNGSRKNGYFILTVKGEITMRGNSGAL